MREAPEAPKNRYFGLAQGFLTQDVGWVGVGGCPPKFCVFKQFFAKFYVFKLYDRIGKSSEVRNDSVINFRS